MKKEEIGIIINNEVYDMSDYESLADLADTEFEGKELSDYTIEELGDVPSRLYNRVDLPCKLDDALETQYLVFSDIFDWVNYVSKYPGSKDATEVYIDLNYEWNPDRFEDSYMGYYSSEEEYAEEYLDEIGYALLGEDVLQDYFNFERYGSNIRDSFGDYTPEALTDYRRELGLPPLDEDESLNRGRLYGFIGDDEDSESEESEDLYNEDDREEAEREYQDFIDENSFDIRMAGIEDDEELGRTFIYEAEGGVSHLPSDIIKEYFDIEGFAETLFYTYSFVDGYVFSDY